MPANSCPSLSEPTLSACGLKGLCGATHSPKEASLDGGRHPEGFAVPIPNAPELTMLGEVVPF